MNVADPLARFELGSLRRAAFERQGYVGPVDVLDAEGVATLRAALDDLLPRLGDLDHVLYEVEAAWTERPGEVVCHFLGGFRVDDRLAALTREPRITVPCAELLGVDRLRFWHDQVFHKPAGHPGVVPWHQDYSYWTRTTPAHHITLNLMLDDADEESGCLMFVPGSHRWGLLPSLPFDSGLNAIEGVLTLEQREAFRPVPVPVRAGQATIHHSHTLHGSGPNRSSRPRRAVVLNFMGPETRVAEGVDAPLLRHTPRLAPGALVDGDDFPIVLDRRADQEHAS